MPVLHLPKEYSFEKSGIKGKTFDAKALTDKIKFTVIETERGHETRIRENECMFHYYILRGKGVFEIDGKIEPCREGDLVIVPKGAAFKYAGKLKMLLISQPPWYSEQEETL